MARSPRWCCSTAAAGCTAPGTISRLRTGAGRRRCGRMVTWHCSWTASARAASARSARMLQRTILESRERVEDAYASLSGSRSGRTCSPAASGSWAGRTAGPERYEACRRSGNPAPGFRAAVAFYPGCIALSQAKDAYHPYAPLLILIGEADDWTPAAPCVELAAKTKAGGDPVEIVTYPGAHHGFDRINLPVRYRPEVRNLNKPVTAAARPWANTRKHAKTRSSARWNFSRRR